MKNDNIFVDTNILVYAYSDTEPEKKEKVLIILEEHDVFISTQVINELIWVMHRKFSVDLKLLEILVNRLFERFKVVLIGEMAIEKALSIIKKYQYSYWDSLIIASALESRCSCLYTEDMHNGQLIEGKLKIINPFLM